MNRLDSPGPGGPEQSIYEVLTIWAERTPGATAIVAPGRPHLTYSGLRAQIERTVGALRAMGLRREDRVAVVLPNGPELAVAFLAITSGATCAPLNPAYGTREFHFYLSDLEAKALLLQDGLDSPARAVALELGIPTFKVSPVPRAEAGVFTLEGQQQFDAAQAGFAQPGDVALVLHTSGTTSRPKLVPLTHTNLLVSAHNFRTAYQLAPADRCLNVMPLFHIHGLVAAILSTLVSGASVACTPGFDASRFFDLLVEYRPTWYTAVPTMHQAILEQAGGHGQAIAGCPLRFIRSCSAALPPTVMADLERVFQVPVLEAYGMTEAALEMTSNPLPPAERKPGSVGVPTGPEVAIMDETGQLLPSGETGEIVIRGANVTRGYENNPQANEAAFVCRWFRTGDQGTLDEDGYLRITGRIKEIINRGGEKVAPREVDEVLLEHPGVVQAVAFAAPHPTLGEDVAAAVVLAPGASVTEQELRTTALNCLAGFKVPSQIVIVDEIPKGPTGKLQRIGLAEELAPELKADYVAPSTAAEIALERIWAEVLGIARVGVEDNFFALGGDSFQALRVLAEIEKIFDQSLPPPALFRAPTIGQLADLLHAGQDEGESARSIGVPLRSTGSKLPLFCIPGNLGNVYTDLSALARHLGPQQPFYGLQDTPDNPARIEALAAYYLDELSRVHPEGPYLLGGICSGGTIAYEMALQIGARGKKVALLAQVEPERPWGSGIEPYSNFVRSVLARAQQRAGHHARQASQLEAAEQATYLRLKLKLLANLWALRRYRPKPFPGQVHIFLTSESLRIPNNPQLKWAQLAVRGAEVHEIPGNHDAVTGDNGAVIQEASMKSLAEKLRGLTG